MFSRREVLAGGAGLAASPLISPDSAPQQRVLRIAHLTDMHVQPEKGAAEGFARALEEAQQHSPDLIFCGGDLIMDALGTDLARAKAQMDLYLSVVKSHSGAPFRHAIGNHDVWGWDSPEKWASDPMFGKQFALERLEMEKPYFHWDQAGWRMIVLDSTHRKPQGGGYTARLDDEQFEWLGGVLASTPQETHVLLLSHIPLFCACAFLDGDNEKSGDWRVPGAWMHIDFRRIKDLLLKHANVKGALSGHIHLADRVDYLGVSYFCNGAVSGGWWGGKYQEFANGYAVVDLFADGSISNRYIEFGWTPR